MLPPVPLVESIDGRRDRLPPWPLSGPGLILGVQVVARTGQ